jgi:hypothetical protein
MRFLPQTNHPHAGPAGNGLSCSIEFRIVLPGWNCVSNSLQGHQLQRSVRLIDLWKQVQKTEETVDFTTTGAGID